jgi:hypothetical protein
MKSLIIKDLQTYRLSDLILMADYYEISYNSKKQLLDRLAAKINKIKYGHMNASDCELDKNIDGEIIDIISLEPIDFNDVVKINGHCYSPSTIKYWINLIKNTPNKPYDPLRNEIKWEDLEKLGYTLDDFPDSWGKIKKDWLFIVAQDGSQLSEVPEELKADVEKYYKICEAAITQNPMALEIVPEEFKTFNFYKIAISQMGVSIQFVSESFKLKEPKSYEELCKIAVSENGMALEYITHQNSKKFYELGLNNNGLALQFIPEELRTKELCEIAVNNYGSALEWIPEKFKTETICKIAVKNSGIALEFIPEELRTPEICKLAVTNDGFALEFVPEKLKTYELCKIAMTNYLILEFVPEKYKKMF